MSVAKYPLIRSARGSYLAGGNGRVTRIVWHRMQAPMRAGVARGTANYFANGSGGNFVSAHFCVDPTEVIRCLDLSDMGYHAPPNGGSIGVELAGYSEDNDWTSPDGESMLRLAANLARDIAAEVRVPVEWLVAQSLVAGKHGHTSHGEVSNAWHQTDHWDPGPYFPVDHFMDLVRGGAAPVPEPDSGDFDMAMSVADFRKNVAATLRSEGVSGAKDAAARAEKAAKAAEAAAEAAQEAAEKVTKTLNRLDLLAQATIDRLDGTTAAILDGSGKG